MGDSLRPRRSCSNASKNGCGDLAGKRYPEGHLSPCRRERIIRLMDWKQTIERWHNLTPEEQARIRLARLPQKVARSMAFEGEPVDQRILEQELDRLGRQPVT